ncbi:MAG TPA: hypothetical protein VG897_13190 [Terriglobales bacterium]|nr:hypothetical protein [Terriglobales bacterium]
MSGRVLLKGKHPVMGDLYELCEDGFLRVTASTGDATGIFKRNGEWISGDLKWADQHFCQWISQKGFVEQSSHRNPLIGQ